MNSTSTLRPERNKPDTEKRHAQEMHQKRKTRAKTTMKPVIMASLLSRTSLDLWNLALKIVRRALVKVVTGKRGG